MAARDPRDVAIDVLTSQEATLARALERTRQSPKTLTEGAASERRRHACPTCGVRFHRHDQLADHLALIHHEAA